jgi:DNA-binding NarL/FixJ family response regulator
MTLNQAADNDCGAQERRIARVLLVDAHRLFREAVRLVINAIDGFEVVGEAANAGDAMQLMESAAPDVIVTDLPLPDRSGGRFIAEFLVRCPQASVLILSASSHEERVAIATKSGAHGYLVKDSGRDELLVALREVAAGRRYLSKACAGTRRRTRESPSSDSAALNLTERQLEVLRSVAMGYRNQDIAERLGVSVKAVQKHRARLSNLLDLRGTAALTLFAVRTGLVPEALGVSKA